MDHQTPGRVRMKFGSAKGNPELLGEISQKFGAITESQRVEVSSTSGSVVLYDDHERRVDFHKHLRRHGEEPYGEASRPPSAKLDEITGKIEDEAEFLARHSHRAKVVVHIRKHLDHRLQDRDQQHDRSQIGPRRRDRPAVASRNGRLRRDAGLAHFWRVPAQSFRRTAMGSCARGKNEQGRSDGRQGRQSRTERLSGGTAANAVLSATTCRAAFACGFPRYVRICAGAARRHAAPCRRAMQNARKS